jgi:hypothetical protein
LAPADTPDLRITMDFADLDPHQKSILSDDFGVAISTQWLFDRLGGFTKIVDGRAFMLRFAHLLRARQRKSKAKVGPSKAPDFVIRDKSGKWHVLECKGTQSGRGWRDRFLKDALSQKQMLRLIGSVRGERLATGLSISHVENRYGTDLRIIDPPDDEPLVTLSDAESAEMEANADRIAVARALGVVGLSEAAIEIALPADVLPGDDLLFTTEARRTRSSRDVRYARAAQQLRDRHLQHFEYQHRNYEGRTALFTLPDPDQTRPFDEIKIRQGVDQGLLQELTSLGPDLDENLTHRIEGRMKGEASIRIISEGDYTSIMCDGVMFADLTLRRA